jgi:hypothetical protein
VQHRLSGRVAVAEKPDVVWDRPDLERLYARLQDEYELKEPAEALSRKLAVISETAEVLNRPELYRFDRGRSADALGEGKPGQKCEYSRQFGSHPGNPGGQVAGEWSA